MGNGLDKRSILAFFLIGVIALFMSTDTYRRWVGMPTSEELAAKQSQTAMTDSLASVAGAETAPAAADAALDSTTLVAGQPAIALADSATASASLAPIFENPATALSERLITVESGNSISVFSTRGASLVRHELKGLKSYTGETVLLVKDGQANLVPDFNINGREVDTRDFLFACEQPDRVELAAGGQASLDFVYTGRDGGRLLKRYILRDGSWRMDVEVELSGVKEPLRHQSWGLSWNSGLELTESSPMQDNMYTEGLALLGTEMEGYRLGAKEPEGSEERRGTVHWVASRNKYFMLALVPLEKNADFKPTRVLFNGRQTNTGSPLAHGQYAFSLDMPMDRQGQLKQSFALYLGPLQKAALADMDPSLVQATMSKTSMGFFGFMWPLIRPFATAVLWIFTKLHLVISNYGIIILIFSLLVKLAVWPLTAKSYRSMRDMQQLKPKLDALKATHAKDARKLQEETMKLYREHKVNPLGGCLPNLLQMPLLFALYFVFRGAFELRGASFVAWITDLSVPDSILTLPFNIWMYGHQVSLLAIIFALSSFLSMRMTTTASTDPQQKMMLYIMPAFMLLFFNQMPSGLTLYYTLFNFLTIAQQQWLTPPSTVVPETLVMADSVKMKRKKS